MKISLLSENGMHSLYNILVPEKYDYEPFEYIETSHHLYMYFYTFYFFVNSVSINISYHLVKS